MRPDTAPGFAVRLISDDPRDPWKDFTEDDLLALIRDRVEHGESVTLEVRPVL